MHATKMFYCVLIVLLPAFTAAVADDAPTRRGIVGVAVKRPADSTSQGVVVARLEIGSPAYRADLKPGDLITHLNGTPIHSTGQFADALYRPRAGDLWNFKCQRGGRSFELTLSAAPVPQEQSTADVRVEYTWFKARDGIQLRGLITSPQKGTGPWPTIFVLPELGGMACDEPEFRQSKALAREFTKAGFVVVRWDQRGSGDSYGTDYADVDFNTEVLDAATLVRTLFDDDRVDQRRIYLLGSGMGGVLAPHVLARQSGVAGLITWGTVSRPLVEYMIDIARAQGTLAKLPAPEINRQVRSVIRFYDKLLEGDRPSEIVQKYPHLADFVSFGEYVQGKSADFWRQLEATPYGQLYGYSTVPVLALYGAHDFVATWADQRNIVDLARASGRKDVQAFRVPGVDHYMNTVAGREESFEKLMTREYKFSPAAVAAAVEWITKLDRLRSGGAK